MKRSQFNYGKGLTLEADERGFTLWHTDDNGCRRWVLDGSTFFNDFSIDLGELNSRGVQMRFKKSTRQLKLKRK